VLQPACGYLADRYGRRPFVLIGPLMTAVFLAAMGLADSFAVLLVLLVLGGLGSAAFHPPGAALSARVSEGGGAGLRLSLFSLGGALGYAAGPLIAVAVVARLGLEGLWWAALPALAVVLVAARWVPGDRPHPDAPRPPGPRQVLGLLRGPLGVVFGISAVGAFIQRVYLTMTPIIGAGEGVSESMGAVALSVYLFAQAGGTVAGGVATDRLNRQALLVGLALTSVPLHALALGLPVGSPGGLTAAAAAGFVNMAMLPPVVVMAQEILPRGAGTGAGIAMGLAWAAGSVVMLGTGALGDLIGARPAALASLPALLLAAGLALHPALRPHRRAVGAVGPAGPAGSGGPVGPSGPTGS